MKLEDYRDTYYTFSAKASDVARQLSFAGIALIWVFKTEKIGPLAIPGPLLWPAFLFIATLALDLFQSVFGSLIWGAFSHYHERKGITDEEEVDSPAYFTWPMLFCFWMKLFALATGYVFVLFYVYALVQAR
jgi:hypothetical protein